MAETKTYHQQMQIKQTLRLREILQTLPAFVKDYFRALEPTSSPKTRISYAYDIRVFFNFLLEVNPAFKNKTIQDFKLSDLERLEPVDIEEYQEYLKVYTPANQSTVMNNNASYNNEISLEKKSKLNSIDKKKQLSNDNNEKYQKQSSQITNGEKGLARKMSALRSLYAYYYKRQLIDKNPTIQVDMPKLHDKAIIRLDNDEVALLLDHIEGLASTLKGQALRYYEKTKQRDLAIVTLLLGTGIRVSECVGLDITDVDFKNDSIKVTRKGGSEMVLYFGEEVRIDLLSYMDGDRKQITPITGNENALFLSTQRKRMGVQSVENMVKKYAKGITGKRITPHKLRSTYGTALYKETGDIYLVADVLGHKDVNTTKKHYAAIDEDRRRSAANVVKLRDV
jgi:site-specific recombinase XerD